MGGGVAGVLGTMIQEVMGRLGAESRLSAIAGEALSQEST